MLQLILFPPQGHSRRMRGVVMGLTLLGEMFLFQKHTNRIIQMEKKSNCNIYIAFMMECTSNKTLL